MILESLSSENCFSSAFITDKHNNKIAKIHVNFFSDQRRAWISSNKLIPYMGVEDLEQRVKCVDKKRKMFASAVEEANRFVCINSQNRLCEFKKAVASYSETKNQMNFDNEYRIVDTTLESPVYEDASSPVNKEIITNELKLIKNILKNGLNESNDHKLTTSRIDLGSLTSQQQCHKKTSIKDISSPITIKSRAKKKKTFHSDSNTSNSFDFEKLSVQDEIPLHKYIRKEFLADSFTTNDIYKISSFKKGEICYYCFYPCDLVKCTLGCQKSYHIDCDEKLRNGEEIFQRKRHYIGNKNSERVVKTKIFEFSKYIKFSDFTYYDKSNLLCCYCELNLSRYCFICEKERLERIIKCSNSACHYFYHESCLNFFPRMYETHNESKCSCPYHFCHTCASLSSVAKNIISKTLLGRCIACPTAYHLNVMCLPAGLEFITASRFICTKHEFGKKVNINVNWCFICARGGELVCCETCPAALHESCLGENISDEKFICDNCKTGR